MQDDTRSGEAPAEGAEPAAGPPGASADRVPDSDVHAEQIGPAPIEAGEGGRTEALAGAVESQVPMIAASPRAAGPDQPNEAVPAVAPEEGSLAIGTTPAALSRRVWARAQASNWRLFLIRFLSAGIAVVATVAFLPGLGFTGWRWGTFTQIGVVFGLLNATVKPLLQFLVLRFIFSTYGIVVVVINTLLLVLLATILEDTFVAYRPFSLLLGGALVGALGLVLETLLGATPPVLDRDYKERNGLK